MNRPTRAGAGRGAPRDGGVHTLKAAIVIIVVVLVGWLVLDKTGSGSSLPKVSSGHTTTTVKTSANSLPGSGVSTTTTTVPLVAASVIKLQVLNGVGHGALAGEWTTKLKTTYGYDTLAPDNATANVASSVIYVITPGYQAEGDRLAQQVGISASAVLTTVPANAPIPPAEKAAANLVLVIGPDLAASA